MKYVSTRGSCPPVSFQEAVLTGLAPDGGLYVPQQIPSVTKEQLQSWVGLTYPLLAEKVVRLFITEEELSSLQLRGKRERQVYSFNLSIDIIKDCFSSFSHPDIVPLQQVGPYNIMEMWHGPTGAFKDLAFVLFARFVDHFLKRQGKRSVALIGTLGDTGSAAISAFKGTDHVFVICLYPKHSISKLQRLQMTTVSAANILNISCESASDDFDGMLKNIFNDKDFSSKYNLLWVNSPNIGRIVCHTVHHIYTYLKMCPSCDREVNFFIPSGALADSTSAYLSYLMGVPIQVTSVVNENDFFYHCLTEGVLRRPVKVVKTYSCAMDTMFPHNVERILYLLSQGDSKMIHSIMEEYDNTGIAHIPLSILEATVGRIKCERISQKESFSVAQHVWKEYQYTLCPHTAVAVAEVAKQQLPSESLSRSVCLATASAAKFQEFLHHLSIPVPTHPSVEGLEEKEEHYKEMKEGENWEEKLRHTIMELNIT